MTLREGNHHIDQEPSRYCSKCGYELRGLTVSRCPECGRGFDPGDSRTFRRRPIRHWLRPVKRAMIGLLVLIFLLASVWGWFFYGWYSEQLALEDLFGIPNESHDRSLFGLTDGSFYADPIVFSWLGDREIPTTRGEHTTWIQAHVGSLGFVLNRVSEVNVSNKTADLNALARLKQIKVIYIRDVNTSDISSLSNLKNIESLTIRGTKVTDLGPLVGLTNLKGLTLDGEITNLKTLARLTNLERLDISGTQVTDLSPLTRLTNLEKLDISGTQVTDLSPLAGLTKMRDLRCQESTVTDLAPLTQLIEMRYLDVSRTEVRDLTPLADFKHIEYLDVSQTKVTNIAPLSGLDKLDRLVLNQTQVTDLSPLTELKHLYDLEVTCSPAKNLTPLMKIKTLEHIHLGESIASPQHIEELKRALPRCCIN